MVCLDKSPTLSDRGVTISPRRRWLFYPGTIRNPTGTPGRNMSSGATPYMVWLCEPRLPRGRYSFTRNIGTIGGICAVPSGRDNDRLGCQRQEDRATAAENAVRLWTLICAPRPRALTLRFSTGPTDPLALATAQHTSRAISPCRAR